MTRRMKSYECNLVKNLPAVPKISNFFTQKIMPWRSPDFLSIFNGRLFWTGGVDITEYRTYRALVR